MGAALALHRIKRASALGLVLSAALLLLPPGAFAQRGAVAPHPVAPNQGAVRAPQAPVARAPIAPSQSRVIGRPNVVNPAFARPLAIVPQPLGTGSLTPLQPLLGSGTLLPLRPGRGFPRIPTLAINPLVRNGFYGLGANALFYGCGGFGWGPGCPMAGLYYGFPSYGFPTVNAPAYTPDISYPSPDPTYMPPNPTAALQYSGVPNQPISLGSLPGDLGSSGSAGAKPLSTTLLYFKDGSIFDVESYAVSGGKLHYVTPFGDEGDVGVTELDVPKTIRENAASGVIFTLTPGRGNTSPRQ